MWCELQRVNWIPSFNESAASHHLALPHIQPLFNQAFAHLRNSLWHGILPNSLPLQRLLLFFHIFLTESLSDENLRWIWHRIEWIVNCHSVVNCCHPIFRVDFYVHLSHVKETSIFIEGIMIYDMMVMTSVHLKCGMSFEWPSQKPRLAFIVMMGFQ